MIRTFVIGNIKIKMKYKKIDIYSIDIVKFRDIDSSDYLSKISQDEYDLIKENFPCCIKDVHEEYQRVKSILVKILKYSDYYTNFIEFYQDTFALICKNEADLETFEKDAFKEVERYASKEAEKNDVFELILLRRKIFIQLFNFVCILYKAKRLLKHIYEAHSKIENKELKEKRKANRPSKLEHAASVAKARGDDESLKPSPDDLKRHESVHQEVPRLLISNKSPIEELDEPATAKAAPIEKEFDQLIREKRPRKTSIEVITEEREDLLEGSDNEIEEAKTDMNVEIPVEEVPKTIQDESIRNMHEQIRIEVSEMSSDQKYTNPEVTVTDSNFEIPEENDEEEQNREIIIEELLGVIQDSEDTFLENENFMQLKQGLSSLE